MRAVALLRGVNLGKRKLVMSELRSLVEGAGFKHVSTLLASGNLVLASKLNGARLEAKLEKLISEGFGLKADVFVRTADELDAIIAANPFIKYPDGQGKSKLRLPKRGTARNWNTVLRLAAAAWEQ